MYLRDDERKIVNFLLNSIKRDSEPEVIQKYEYEMARMSRLKAACDMLEIFSGSRPRDDDDVFYAMKARKEKLADEIAAANLEQRIKNAPDGLYIAIPFLCSCSEFQPIWLVNRTGHDCRYFKRDASGFASADDEVVFLGNSSHVSMDLANETLLPTGERLYLGSYSMIYDGDFITSHKLDLEVNGLREIYFTSISKLGGYLSRVQDNGIPIGMHKLEPIDAA